LDGLSDRHANPNRTDERIKVMNETLVKVENASKKFCRDLKRSLWYGMRDLGSELLGKPHNGGGLLREKEFWAVKDASFELKRGECLGLIGPNGAGKTTLLRMLNGLIKPDRGRIEMRGRIGALIALGAGFNPILTGRENIYVNAAVLGLSKKEIDAKFDEIVAFAELDQFIDAPVQSYSSGMAVRLGFAVASALDPDILIIDEVLAVGDISFILKCINRIDRILANTAIIFVSHNMPQIERICTKLILMKTGEVVHKGGNIHEGLNLYYSMFYQNTTDFTGSDEAKLKEVRLGSGSRLSVSNDSKAFTIDYGAGLDIYLHFEVDIDLLDIQVNIAFFDQSQRLFGAIYSTNNGLTIDCKNGLVFLKVTVPDITFAQGIYSITVVCKEGDAGQVLFRRQSAAYFQVVGKMHGWAPVIFPANWRQFNQVPEKSALQQ